MNLAIKSRSKALLAGAVGRLGYKLVRKGQRLQLGDAINYLRDRGLSPATLIDLGVADGTPELYDAFPGAKLLLVEPNTDWRPVLQPLVERRGGSLHLCAAGPADGTLRLHVWPEHPGCSTVITPTRDTGRFREARDVPVRRIDDLVAASGLAGTYLLKIDVQGAELQALAGADATLGRCAAVVVEVTLRPAGEVPDFLDVAAHLRARGFVLFDLVGRKQRRGDSALDQIDAVFLPAASPLLDKGLDGV